MGKRGFLYVFGAIALFSNIVAVSKYMQSGRGTGKPLGADQVASLRFILGGLLLLPFAVFFLFHQGVERASASEAAWPQRLTEGEEAGKGAALRPRPG